MTCHGTRCIITKKGKEANPSAAAIRLTCRGIFMTVYKNIRGNIELGMGFWLVPVITCQGGMSDDQSALAFGGNHIW